jgi:hypothetical protein
MELTYKWTILKLETKLQYNHLQKVVVCSHWIRSVTDNIYFAESRNSTAFDISTITDFTPYEDLTEELVCSWLEESIDVEAIDLALIANIEMQKNPPIVILPLPWENSDSE